MTSTDAIAAKNAFVLITNKFVIKTNALTLRPSVLSWNSKHWAIISRVVINHGAWLDHESLPAYFKLTAWIAANVYAYVHGHTRTHRNPHNQHEISSKTLSTSSLTINAPLIVKDEVDKSFRTYPFTTKQKILCGLKAYCCQDKFLREINCSNALNFMTSTDAIAAKNAFVLITNKFVIKTKLMRRHSVLSWNSKHWAIVSRVIINHGAWLDHESLLLILSWLRGLRPMCTRMSMDIRVHGHPRSLWDKFENFINFIFNNQCTIDC